MALVNINAKTQISLILVVVLLSLSLLNNVIKISKSLWLDLSFSNYVNRGRMEK